MKCNPRNQFILVLVSALSAIFFSTTVLAQTDINIDNTNIIEFGGDVTVAPQQVVENAHAIGGTVTVQEKARVTQTAIAIDGDVILEKGARVDGDVYVVGGKIITDAGASIGGASGAVLENGRWMSSFRRGGSFFWRYLINTAFHLLNVIVSAIIGILIIRWRPNFLRSLAATINQYPLQCGLWGLGGLLAAILLVILLAVSLIGIALLPSVGLVITVTVLLGNLGLALWLGQKTLTSEESLIKAFLIGMLILGVIGLIPVLGGLVLSVVNIFGFGIVLVRLWGKGRSQTPAGSH